MTETINTLTLVKLTEAQADLLRRSCRSQGQRCARNYKPAVKLAKLGLVLIHEVTQPFGWQIFSTTSGRAHPVITKP